MFLLKTLLSKTYKLLPIILLMGLSQFIFAQKYVQDVLLLKNGDKIKGTIFEQNEESIKIRLYGGSEFTFKLEEIAEITTEEFKKQTHPNVKKKGYYNLSTISLLQTNSIQTNFSNIHTVNGYHFNPKLALGLGIGVNSYNRREIQTWAIYTSLSGDLAVKRELAPTYAIDIGLSSRWKSFNRKDLYQSYSFGLKTRFNNNWAWILLLNLTIQDSYGRYLFLKTGAYF